MAQREKYEVRRHSYFLELSIWVGHPRLPDRKTSQLLDTICRAYQDKSEEFVQKGLVRVGLPAPEMMKILEYGVKARSGLDIRDCALIVLARIHGLRASSAQEIPSVGLAMLEEQKGWTCLVTKLKGRTVQAASRLGSRCFRQNLELQRTVTPVALLEQWIHIRPENPNFFYMQGNEPNLDSAVRRLTALLDIIPPEGCVYSSHSCRIAAYTENLLSNDISPAVLLHQFNWKSRDMPRIYFDHRMMWSKETLMFASVSVNQNVKEL